MQETVPDAPMAFLKPSAPFCLSGYRFSRRHTCSEREMNAYIERLKGYTDSVFDYAEKAAAFANSAMNFARHAEDYAKCEAREAKGELQ